MVTAYVVLTTGRRVDVTGLDARQVIEVLKAQGITGEDIDHVVHVLPPGPLPPNVIPFATRDLRRWLDLEIEPGDKRSLEVEALDRTPGDSLNEIWIAGIRKRTPRPR